VELNSRIIIPETVLAQEIDGEMVLLDMNSEHYFGLDAVGTAIWEAMQVSNTLQEAKKRVLDMYEVEEDVLQKDLAVFVEKLQKSGLIEVERG